MSKKGWINLARVLEQQDITLYKFAQLLNVPSCTVTSYFREGYNPTIETILKWCDVLQVGLNDLYDDRLDRRRKEMPRPSYLNINEKNNKEDS